MDNNISVSKSFAKRETTNSLSAFSDLLRVHLRRTFMSFTNDIILPYKLEFENFRDVGLSRGGVGALKIFDGGVPFFGFQ